MIVVTHEMGFARKVANRVVFMDKGEIVEDAPTADFFGKPRSERAQTVPVENPATLRSMTTGEFMEAKVIAPASGNSTSSGLSLASIGAWGASSTQA